MASAKGPYESIATATLSSMCNGKFWCVSWASAILIGDYRAHSDLARPCSVSILGIVPARYHDHVPLAIPRRTPAILAPARNTLSLTTSPGLPGPLEVEEQRRQETPTPLSLFPLPMYTTSSRTPPLYRPHWPTSLCSRSIRKVSCADLPLQDASWSGRSFSLA